VSGERPQDDKERADRFRHSSLLEKVIEHLFVGELLCALWKQGNRDFEVLRAEVDRGGYDLAIECGGVLRHIQLKASHKDAKTRSVNVNIGLGLKPYGCVIWILFDVRSLELGPFRWWGNDGRTGPVDFAGMDIARHTKANAAGLKSERPGLRVVRQSSFCNCETIEEVARRLFADTRNDV
jgi:hypothetical protein